VLRPFRRRGDPLCGAMSLRVSALACRRAGRPVLADLSFAVAPGETLLLQGPNGVGKSTLLRVLAGLVPVEAGRVTLDGIDLDRDADSYLERIAYAGHLDAIKPQLTVVENLRFWAALYGAPGAVGDAMEAFALTDLAGRPAHICSAGQKRRLGLARLMLAPRQLWLLDEPTVSLDAATVARFAEVVRRHCAGGGIALVATHVDLGLEGARRLTLAPIAAQAPGAAADPFLAGAWAGTWE